MSLHNPPSRRLASFTPGEGHLAPGASAWAFPVETGGRLPAALDDELQTPYARSHDVEGTAA
ncbi:hypothetical protein [Streptomyces sp. ME19-01-6]|uniref:hypothetical protein n=1 Tax=Streptomyces sp. ME19-01-6 TaxID=3028686 RepID=UPI0029BF5E94|nr:hypothetical protein [Streptomyces sp. ME19-01-6]MDX3231782.1 hypothetical protein [Streptomyces sp. ME19-01-6]